MVKVNEPIYHNFSIKFRVINKLSEPFTSFRVYKEIK